MDERIGRPRERRGWGVVSWQRSEQNPSDLPQSPALVRWMLPHAD